MSVNDIIEKIKSDSDATADEILAEARGRAEEKLADARRRAEEAARERHDEAEREAETVHVRTLALARLAARDAKLACKQAIVERVFEKAADKIKALDPGAYAKLLEKLLVERAEGRCEVAPARVDAGVFDDAFLARATQSLGSKATISLARPTDEIERGFMLRAGRIITDCSIATLVAEAREDLAADVHQRLFGEEASG